MNERSKGWGFWVWLTSLLVVLAVSAVGDARAQPAGPAPKASASGEAKDDAKDGDKKDGDKKDDHKKDGDKKADPKDAPKEPEEGPSRKGEVHEIGVILLAVNKIDVVKEIWEYDAIITFATKGRPYRCKKEEMAAMFAGGLKKIEEADKWEDDGKAFVQCKVTLEEDSTIDVSRYPFDHHLLEIKIGEEADAIDGAEFKPMEDKMFVAKGPKLKLSGWEFGELVGTQEQIEHPHKKGATITRVRFDLHTFRPLVSSVVKTFLGVIFQLLIALVALVLAVKAAPNRIALVTGALIATATAHNTVSSQVGVAYLTTADKFFMVSYFLLLTNVTFSALMIRAEDAKNDARIKTLYNTAFVVLPLLTIVATALVLIGVL